MKKLKHVIGIDVAKDNFVVCFGHFDQSQKVVFSKEEIFTNNKEGFEKLIHCVKQRIDKAIDCWYVMEATGVYYENLAFYLSEKQANVCVLLPNKTKHYAKSLEIKSKTDKIDAKILVQIGLERNLQKWNVPTKLMHSIKALTREYKDNKTKLTMIKNQIHAKNHGYEPPKETIKRLKAQIKLLEVQLLQIEFQLKNLVYQDEALLEKVIKIESIPGVSFMTIICILAETNGFALVENVKQLVSYAGMDIVLHESGLLKKKSRISKKGNRFIRHALYMPALCAIQHNQDMKLFYHNLVERKKIKKVGVTAVARKMLILIYTLWKNESEYIENYKAAAA